MALPHDLGLKPPLVHWAMFHLHWPKGRDWPANLAIVGSVLSGLSPAVGMSIHAGQLTSGEAEVWSEIEQSGVHLSSHWPYPKFGNSRLRMWWVWRLIVLPGSIDWCVWVMEHVFIGGQQKTIPGWYGQWTVVDSSGQCPLCSRLLFEEAEETMMKAGAS